jgi:zinc protease
LRPFPAGSVRVATLLTFLSASSLFAAPSPRVETLENGLKVVLLEDHASSLVAATVWVHVGGKNETEQVAGFSHFLEHLIPQGTKNRTPRQEQLEIFQSGGISSIQADYDRTFFFFLVPKEAQDKALDDLALLVSQADLSAGAVDKLKPQISREMREAYDNPAQVLFLEQMRAAFPGQPYRYPFYGSFANLSNLEPTTAAAFYRNFYVANNMVVAVGGDINPALTLTHLRKAFGGLRPSKTLPPKPKFEGGGKGSRQVMKNLGDLPPSISLLFPTPGYRHADRWALTVLARLLNSAAMQELRGSRESGQLIFSASADFRLLEERGLLALTGYPASPQALEPAVRAMTSMLARVRSEGFPQADFRRTLEALRLETAVRRSTLGAVTQEVAEATLFGDPRYGWNVESSLAKITADDVRRVAAEYLVADNGTQLLLFPKEERRPAPEILERISGAWAALRADGKAPAPGFDAAAYAGEKQPLAARPERRPPTAATRNKLPNGLTVILKSSPGQGIVSLSLQIRAGFAFDPEGKEGAAQMVAASLPLGSATLSAAEFRDRAAALGSSFGITLSVETAESGLTVFPEKLKGGLDLLAGAVQSPSFDEKTLPAVRDRLARFREALAATPRDTAMDLAREKVFRRHPYGRPTIPSDVALQSLRRDDLVSFHRSFYRPGRAVLTIVGDFNPTSVMGDVQAAFAGWTAGEKNPPELEEVGRPEPLAGEFSRMVEASPSEVVLAYPGVSLKDPQFPMLRALGTILSARGFVDLVLNQGLAFSVLSNAEGLSRGGVMALEATSPRSGAARVAYELMLRVRTLGLKEVSAQTVQDVKAVERGRLLREKEILYTQASALGFYELLGPGFGVYDEGKTLPQDLSPAKIQEAATRFLDTSQLVRITAGVAPR